MWMGLENIMLSEINQRKTNTIITYMWNLKNNTNECICKTETYMQNQKINLWLPREEGNREGQN